MLPIDMKGQRCGRLSVVARAANTKSGKARWECLCDCGKTVIVTGVDLRSGHTTSCGCFHSERSSNILRSIALGRTGNKNNAYRHGATKTKLYSVWSQMIQRCTNPNHKRYSDWGGRGITVCDEWKNDFAVFNDWAKESGYSDGLTLDRIDNDKGYCPENCRWATIAEQNRNKRKYRRKTDGK